MTSNGQEMEIKWKRNKIKSNQNICCEIIWYDLIWYDIIQHDMIWYGMTRHIRW